jgi:major membrane immunogen (membrane-anchored lipoprotein)
VVFFIQRLGDKKYFTGTNYSTNPVPLATTYAGNNNYVRRTAMPTGVNLSEGKYAITAKAFDNAGHSDSDTQTVTVDLGSPVVTFTSPTNNASVVSLPAVVGTARDTALGSGVTRVQLFIQRRSDGKYFNGTTFVQNSVALTTDYTPSTGRFVRRSGLPSGTNLTAGSYLLTAKAFDRAGRVGRQTITVQVGSLSPAVAGAALSTATAAVAGDSISLKFTTALDAEAASTPSNYVVRVNDEAIEVESAAYTNGAVVLSLGAGTLQANDSVSITWEIAAATGDTIAGTTSVIAR